MSRLAHPWLLLGLSLVPLLIVWFVRRSGGEPALRYSETSMLRRLEPSLAVRLHWLPFALRLCALALLVVALARPQRGVAGEEIRAEGVDIMLVIDVSSSMLAEDFQPNNRLLVAKEVVSDFISRRDNDRLGMIVFARHALTKTPLTLDHDILLTHLEGVEIGSIPDGTAIGNAIASGVNRLKASDAKSRLMILLTDGENTAGEVDPITAARLAKTFGIKVYTVGVGRGGLVPFPFRDPLYGTVYRNVEIPIDEQTLEQIAELTEGRFFRARDAESLRSVYEEIDTLERTEIEQVQYVRYTELAPRFMVAALGFLMLEALLARTRFSRFP
ncbi:MAG TPA: VWA domain-containing protein [Vicinamibacteria bacterium]|nr:VWA domain-containing protein [Vicinamibacteria bacterium]